MNSNNDTLKSAVECQVIELGRVVDKIDCRGLEHRRDTELYAHCESVRTRRQMLRQEHSFDEINVRISDLTAKVDQALGVIREFTKVTKTTHSTPL